MRNLKRALSLLLSSTMVLGMLVMGSSAVGYQDVDASNDHQEAIEVLQQVGIMTGDENGNFDPDGSITRNEMAVVMAHLLNLDYDYYRGVNTFTDVPSWAAPYVAACVAEGVTAGIGNNLYGGDQPITAAQGSLMIMKALGYFQNQEDFGSDWQVATIRQASYINLFDRVNSDADSALTRAQVAQLVLNGLKSNMVTFTGDKGVQIGDVTVGYHAEYTPVTNAAAKYNSIVTGTTTIIGDNGQYYVQLGEELYNGDLKLANGDDDFMRPSRVWSYKGTEIGTYAKKELVVESYTKGVTGKTMYELLSAATIEEYDLDSYVDGDVNTIKKSDMARSNDSNLANTGNGVVTEVYVDNNAEEITIVSINSYLAKATADYNSDKEYAPLNVYLSDANGRSYNVDVDEVAEVADVTEDTFYQVNISYKDNTTIGEVKVINDVKVLEDSTVTKFSAENNGMGTGKVTKLTTDGTEYSRNVKAYYDDDILDEYDAALLTDATYNVYVDANGYFLGVDLYEGTKNYVFITGYDLSGSNIAVETAKAGAIFLDGTMKAIDVNVKATNDNIADATGYNAAYFNPWTSANAYSEINEWYTYTVDADGDYTLKPAVRMTQTKYAPASDVIVRTDNLSIVDTEGNKARVYGEDASVFITVDTGDVSDTTLRGITNVDGVYTGVQNVELEIDTTSADALNMGQIFTVYDNDYYVVGAIVLGDAVGANENLAFILTGALSEEKIDDTYYWTFDAILNGQVQTFTAKSKYQSTIQALKPFNVQELRFDGDYVTNIKNLDASDLYTNNTVAIGSQSVYQMRGLVAANNTLNLQGRTLYITANRTDVGLALAADAKAVVIQDENKSTNVKTEFTSVSSAISHLADPDNNTVNGIQYKGAIYAILDSNGVAQWVVFDSDTPLTTGSTVTPDPTDYTPVVTQNGTFLDVQAHTIAGDSNVVYTAVWNWLVNNGYNVVNAQRDSSQINSWDDNWTFIATKGGNSTFFQTNLIPMIKLHVNDVEKFIRADGSLTWDDVLDGPNYFGSSSQITTVGITGSVPALSSVATTAIRETDYAMQDGMYYKDSLYPVTVGSTTYYYQIGEKIALSAGSYYSDDGSAVSAANAKVIPAGGLKMSADLSGDTIKTAWKVTVKAAANGNPSDFVEYVVDGGTTSATDLSANTWYRTNDGEMVKTDGSEYFTNVKSDITISSNTEYVEVTLPSNTSLAGVQITVDGNAQKQYVAKTGTITVKVTLNGTGNGSTITLGGSGATATAAASVDPISGIANGFTAMVDGSNQLVITATSGKTVSNLTYAVTFTVASSDVTFTVA